MYSANVLCLTAQSKTVPPKAGMDRREPLTADSCGSRPEEISEKIPFPSYSGAFPRTSAHVLPPLVNLEPPMVLFIGLLTTHPQEREDARSHVIFVLMS